MKCELENKLYGRFTAKSTTSARIIIGLKQKSLGFKYALHAVSSERANLKMFSFIFMF